MTDMIFVLLLFALLVLLAALHGPDSRDSHDWRNGPRLP